MCEILFRGKRKDTGEWMESPTVLKTDNHMYMCKSSMCEITYDLQYNITAIMSKKPFFVEVIPETIGQYTGLTDRNGNKIFEGDILRSTETSDIEIVQWFPEHAAFMVWCKYLNEIGFLYECACIVEIIGNIHDNPELLEKKE